MRIFLALAMGGALISATKVRAQEAGARDSAAVAAVVDGFRGALARGDSAGAMELLGSDAIVMEGGGVERRAEYAAGHLAADMSFLGRMHSEILFRKVTVSGATAWVGTTSRTTGEYHGTDLELESAESMVLSLGPGGWRIRAIHWSSARR